MAKYVLALEHVIVVYVNVKRYVNTLNFSCQCGHTYVLTYVFTYAHYEI